MWYDTPIGRKLENYGQSTEINSTSETYTRDESNKWTDERKRKHIMEHANITVPEEYREQYIELNKQNLVSQMTKIYVAICNNMYLP